jgi:hypothetical protein
MLVAAIAFLSTVPQLVRSCRLAAQLAERGQVALP